MVIGVIAYVRPYYLGMLDRGSKHFVAALLMDY
jgi:hypothetical protein